MAGVQAQRPEVSVAAIQGVVAELAPVVGVLVEAVDGRQVAQVAARGQPHQARRGGGLRGQAVPVAEPEPDPRVVGHEPRVSLGHRRLDLLKPGLGELLGGPVAVVQAERGRAEGGSDLLEVGAHQIGGDPQRRRERDHQRLRIRFGNGAVSDPGISSGSQICSAATVDFAAQ